MNVNFAILPSISRNYTLYVLYSSGIFVIVRFEINISKHSINHRSSRCVFCCNVSITAKFGQLSLTLSLNSYELGSGDARYKDFR